ncbi:unnamed protein product [Amoebophrya sp. A25]|nr:unnamed protein product [Amoebophrya sp. A25]|eukprot:GSA25T00026701001.1
MPAATAVSSSAVPNVSPTATQAVSATQAASARLLSSLLVGVKRRQQQEGFRSLVEHVEIERLKCRFAHQLSALRSLVVKLKEESAWEKRRQLGGGDEDAVELHESDLLNHPAGVEELRGDVPYHGAVPVDRHEYDNVLGVQQVVKNKDTHLLQHVAVEDEQVAAQEKSSMSMASSRENEGDVDPMSLQIKAEGVGELSTEMPMLSSHEEDVVDQMRSPDVLTEEVFDEEEPDIPSEREQGSLPPPPPTSYQKRPSIQATVIRSQVGVIAQGAAQGASRVLDASTGSLGSCSLASSPSTTVGGAKLLPNFALLPSRRSPVAGKPPPRILGAPGGIFSGAATPRGPQHLGVLNFTPLRMMTPRMEGRLLSTQKATPAVPQMASSGGTTTTTATRSTINGSPLAEEGPHHASEQGETSQFLATEEGDNPTDVEEEQEGTKEGDARPEVVLEDDRVGEDDQQVNTAVEDATSQQHEEDLREQEEAQMILDENLKLDTKMTTVSPRKFAVESPIVAGVVENPSRRHGENVKNNACSEEQVAIVTANSSTAGSCINPTTTTTTTLPSTSSSSRTGHSAPRNTTRTRVNPPSSSSSAAPPPTASSSSSSSTNTGGAIGTSTSGISTSRGISVGPTASAKRASMRAKMRSGGQSSWVKPELPRGGATGGGGVNPIGFLSPMAIGAGRFGRRESADNMAASSSKRGTASTQNSNASSRRTSLGPGGGASSVVVAGPGSHNTNASAAGSTSTTSTTSSNNISSGTTSTCTSSTSTSSQISTLMTRSASTTHHGRRTTHHPPPGASSSSRKGSAMLNNSINSSTSNTPSSGSTNAAIHSHSTSTASSTAKATSNRSKQVLDGTASVGYGSSSSATIRTQSVTVARGTERRPQSLAPTFLPSPRIHLPAKIGIPAGALSPAMAPRAITSTGASQLVNRNNINTAPSTTSKVNSTGTSSTSSGSGGPPGGLVVNNASSTSSGTSASSGTNGNNMIIGNNPPSSQPPTIARPLLSTSFAFTSPPPAYRTGNLGFLSPRINWSTNNGPRAGG